MLSRRQAFFGTAALALASALPASLAHAATGRFTGRGRYAVTGSATASGGTVALSSDFRTTNGPDLKVFVGNGRPSRSLGRLKSNSGAQTYTASGSFTHVYIYCERFSAIFGVARVD